MVLIQPWETIQYNIGALQRRSTESNPSIFRNSQNILGPETYQALFCFFQVLYKSKPFFEVNLHILEGSYSTPPRLFSNYFSKLPQNIGNSIGFVTIKLNDLFSLKLISSYMVSFLQTVQRILLDFQLLKGITEFLFMFVPWP